MWIVQAWDYHDDKEEPIFELSVVQSGSHGTKSWGWDGHDKWILFQGVEDEFDQLRWDTLLEVAKALVKDLNSRR